MNPEIRFALDIERRSTAGNRRDVTRFKENSLMTLSLYRWIKVLVVLGVVSMLLLVGSAAVGQSNSSTLNSTTITPAGDLSAQPPTTQSGQVSINMRPAQTALAMP